MNTDDYRELNENGIPVLTTKFLKRDLDGWAGRLKRMKPSDVKTHVDSIMEILSGTQKFVSLFSSCRDSAPSFSVSDPKWQFWSVHGQELFPEDLELSICALCYTIDGALQTIHANIFGNRMMPVSNREAPRLMLTRLMEMGFCKSDLQHFAEIQALLTHALR